ncbi:MAG: hypothetical protein JSS96_03855 [Bacteroidetes bacterium]|nr:hypothetical protein [Bacteroidota bacterium]
MKRTMFLLLILAGINVTAKAQNFSAMQKKQEAIIKSAHKHKKISDNEYEKLMKEQGQIKVAIAKAEADEVWTAHEKNAVNSKLEKAKVRLSKYENNSEVY